jgi:hypothetical protein
MIQDLHTFTASYQHFKALKVHSAAPPWQTIEQWATGIYFEETDITSSKCYDLFVVLRKTAVKNRGSR